MKSIINFFGITLITLLVFGSCNKDSSDRVTRDDFLGTYDCYDEEPTYEITISATDDSNGILIKNIGGWYNAEAEVNGNTFEFMSESNSQSHTGHGTLDGNELTIHVELLFTYPSPYGYVVMDVVGIKQ